MPWPTLIPFPALLLCIAVLPVAAGHWWEQEKHRALVSGSLALPIAVYLLLAGEAHLLGESLQDYAAFLALLGSLFVISGGIHIRGSLAGTPASNSAMLAIGAVLANLIGTTGASMVLIRPLLRANEERHRVSHIVIFFILTVSNCGGLLTPLGDPPLFLGFLHGVPFTWTLLRLWAPWLLVNGALIAVFHVIDGIVLDKEEIETPQSLLREVLEHEPLRIEGARNLAFLAAIVLVLVGRGEGWGAGGGEWAFGVQEVAMLAIGAAAFVATPSIHRDANRFTFGPIIEVAVLFFGIFVTMVPVMVMLHEMGPRLGLDAPWKFFWATGTLSSFLDNAPTYLTFAAAAAGSAAVPMGDPAYLGSYLATGPLANRTMAAISAGAVFMGAMTYIGNGPNFMVKAIAEAHGVRMPSFFGYMRWSLAVLAPLLVIVTLIFFL